MSVKNFEEKLEKHKALLQSYEFAQELYAALCNQDWEALGDPSDCAGGSWRYNGGIVADARGMGEDYLDFYCSGHEGQISDRIRKFMQELGYVVVREVK